MWICNKCGGFFIIYKKSVIKEEFKIDKEGNEILVPDTSSVLVLGKTGDGSRTVAHEQKRKVEDDQTSDVPPIFAEWKKREGLSW